MEVIFEETSLQEDYKYRVEIHYKDDKVADLVKGAIRNSPEGIITSYDIEQWIGAAIDGNINIFITEPTSKLYYIGPSTWRMEMLAKMPTQALAKEIIAEIEIKTAKRLTELVKVEKARCVPPKSFEMFVKEDTNADWNKVKETIKKVAEEIKETEMSEATHEDILKYVNKNGITFCAWFKPTWKRDETVNISVDDVFNECITQVVVNLDTPNIQFAKTIENNTHRDFYDKVCRSLQEVEIIWAILLNTFKTAYEDYFKKELNKAILRHNVNARALYAKEQEKKAEAKMNRQIETKGTLRSNLRFEIAAVVDFAKDVTYDEIFQRATTPVCSFILTLQDASKAFFRVSCSIHFNMDDFKDNDLRLDKTIMEQASIFHVDGKEVNKIIEALRVAVIKGYADFRKVYITAPIKSKKPIELLKELYDTEANWVATSKTHRRILYELDHLEPFQTAVKRQDLKKEERDVKEILKRLREHYEELYAAIRERLEQEES